MSEAPQIPESLPLATPAIESRKFKKILPHVIFWGSMGLSLLAQTDVREIMPDSIGEHASNLEFGLLALAAQAMINHPTEAFPSQLLRYRKVLTPIVQVMTFLALNTLNVSHELLYKTSFTPDKLSNDLIPDIMMGFLGIAIGTAYGARVSRILFGPSDCQATPSVNEEVDKQVD